MFHESRLLLLELSQAHTEGQNMRGRFRTWLRTVNRNIQMRWEKIGVTREERKASLELQYGFASRETLIAKSESEHSDALRENRSNKRRKKGFPRIAVWVRLTWNASDWTSSMNHVNSEWIQLLLPGLFKITSPDWSSAIDNDKDRGRRCDSDSDCITIWRWPVLRSGKRLG
jgi:hypothetical protein